MLSTIPLRYLRPLRDVAAIRRREQLSFKKEGDSFPMMMRAGNALYRHILKRAPELSHLAVVVGGGNNGGDGLIVAHLAAQEGINVHLYDASASPRSGDAERAALLLDQQEGIVRYEIADLVNETAPVIVDALLGIGFKAPLSPAYEIIIDMINELGAAGTQVISVDCPSGLELTSGYAEKAISADLVVSFIDDKIGHYLRDGAVCCHEVVIESLQAVDLEEPPQAYFLAPSLLDKFPPCPRVENSHKGTYAHVTVLGGDIGYGGAAIMASEAAAKAGAGTVCLLTQERHLNASLARNPNVMCLTNDDRVLAETLRDDRSVTVIGPGLGRSSWSHFMWQQVLDLQSPVVIDADGLYWLKKEPCQAKKVVITPHPGEAASLLDVSVADVLQDLVGTALELAKRYQAVVVLKGATSVVAGPDGAMLIVGRPCPALAKGGSGDVLSGMIGACLAYYQDPFEAAVLGAAWHNKSAIRCAQQVGMVMMQPYQILDYLE